MDAYQLQAEKNEMLSEVMAYHTGKLREYKDFVVKKLHIKTPSEAGARSDQILNIPTPTEEDAYNWIIRLSLEQLATAGA